MSFKILRTAEFSSGWKQLSKKHVSMRQDFANLLESLEANPTQGESLGNNCYKVRVAIKVKEKASVVEREPSPAFMLPTKSHFGKHLR
jgi:mRNA-degrading endonuclease RelE of RelBE toxin-antitoxin system